MGPIWTGVWSWGGQGSLRVRDWVLADAKLPGSSRPTCGHLGWLPTRYDRNVGET